MLSDLTGLERKSLKHQELKVPLLVQFWFSVDRYQTVPKHDALKQWPFDCFSQFSGSGVLAGHRSPAIPVVSTGLEGPSGHLPPALSVSARGLQWPGVTGTARLWSHLWGLSPQRLVVTSSCSRSNSRFLPGDPKLPEQGLPWCFNG